MDKNDITAMKFIDLSTEDRVDILDRVSTELNIRQREVIEKDWWVTAVLRAMFSLPYANHLSFKGGTSLSKCWHLIDRFSEDIDIAIDREHLGFNGTLSKTQISDKLRRAACSFVRDSMQHDLAERLYQNGISKEKVQGECGYYSCHHHRPRNHNCQLQFRVVPFHRWNIWKSVYFAKGKSGSQRQVNE